VYFEYICSTFARRLLDRVNGNIEQTSSKRRADVEQTLSWLKQAYWNPIPWLKCRPMLRILAHSWSRVI